eukprot:m.100843 g.100843  ORF g.100843 m.100843 type:complete len:328 (+) comp12559_c0_seq1:188-1171(+)
MQMDNEGNHPQAGEEILHQRKLMLNDKLFPRNKIIGNECVSVQTHKLNEEDVRLKQLQGASHILEIAEKKSISIFCAATACYFYHHFYAFQSIKTFNPRNVAIASLLLSTNSSQRPHYSGVPHTRVSLKSLLEASHSILNGGVKLAEKSSLYRELQEQVLLIERVMLGVFEFNVEVTTYMDYIVIAHDAPYISYLIALATTFLSSPLCLVYSSRDIALSLILKHEDERHERGKQSYLDESLWEGEDVSQEVLRGIISEIDTHTANTEEQAKKHPNCLSIVDTLDDRKKKHIETQQRRRSNPRRQQTSGGPTRRRSSHGRKSRRNSTG